MSGDTVVAISNSFTVTIKITAKVKLQVRRTLEGRGVKSNFVLIRMFVGAIVLAMRGHLAEVTDVTIDEEYTGYEAIIKSLLLDRRHSLGGTLTLTQRQDCTHRQAVARAPGGHSGHATSGHSRSDPHGQGTIGGLLKTKPGAALRPHRSVIIPVVCRKFAQTHPI